MADMTSDARRVLQRIAEALGTDVSSLYGRPDPKPELARDLSELIRVFETIEDADDRRSCLDFVRSVAAGQPAL